MLILQAFESDVTLQMPKTVTFECDSLSMRLMTFSIGRSNSPSVTNIISEIMSLFCTSAIALKSGSEAVPGTKSGGSIVRYSAELIHLSNPSTINALPAKQMYSRAKGRVSSLKFCQSDSRAGCCLELKL